MASFGIFESVIVERLLRIVSEPPSPWLVTLSQYVPIWWRERRKIGAEACSDHEIAKYMPVTHELPFPTDHRLYEQNNQHGTNQRWKSVIDSHYDCPSPLWEGHVNKAFHFEPLDIYNDQTEPTIHLRHERNRRRSWRDHRSPSINTERHFDSDDLPETRSQLETTIARPSILGKSSTRRKIAYTTTKIQQQRNALLWTEVCTRIDIASFALCSFSAIFIPVILFVPLVSDSECAEPELANV